MCRVFTDGFRKQFADRAVCGFRWVGRADNLTVGRNSILAFENLNDDGGGGNEFAQFVIGFW